MIDDAGPWKCELLRVCQEMLDCYAEPDLFPGAGLDDESQQVFLVERAAFLTAFTVRKLSEAGKISVQFLSKSIPYGKHAIVNPERAPEKLNQHRVFDFFNGTRAQSRMSYQDFANLLIHSATFTPIADDLAGKVSPRAFAVTSDRTRHEFLSVFETSDLVRYVRDLAADDVVAKRMFRDGNGDYVEVGSNRPLSSAEFEEYFQQAGRREAKDRIVDTVFGRTSRA